MSSPSKHDTKGFNKLISSNEADDRDNASNVEFPFVSCQTYDENEETTCIDVAILLTKDPIKRWLVAPLLSLITLFVWPIFLYWKIPMQRDWLYNRAVSVDRATHLYIEGRGKK